VIGIGAGLLALAAIYLIDLLLTSGEIERGTTIAGVDRRLLLPMRRPRQADNPGRKIRAGAPATLRWGGGAADSGYAGPRLPPWRNW
jgi:hypothetical protein